MSRTIDQKVVEMRFDNAQFEQNVKTSMGTLDNLKKSLNMDGATRGLENVNQAVNNMSFDKMASGIEALQDRFSTLGIIGMRVIQNLTDAAMSFVNKGLNFVTEGVVQGGIRRAMNLENAHFQLQGLLKDETKVQAVMKNVQDAVDGTAYGLDSAAKAASQLAASGMAAGDDMFKALRGIAGVAAMTNSDYESIADIFTTVAGNGRLMGMQLTQLASRGLNAAATLGEQLGVTEAEVRDMVSKGKIDFQTFANAMDDAFGEHAKKANETFTGSISNIKSALGRIGALFISPLIEQNNPVIKLLNAIRERINDIKKGLEPLALTFTNFVKNVAGKLANTLGNLKVDKSVENFVNIVTPLGGALANVFSALISVMKKAGEAFKMVFPEEAVQGVIKFCEHLKELSKNLKLGEKPAENLRDAFGGFFSIIKLQINFIKAIGDGIGKLASKLTGLPSDIFEIAGAIGRWVTSTVDAIEQNGILSIVIGDFGETLGGAISSIRDYLKETNLLQKFGETISSVFSKIGSIITGVGPKIKDILGSIGSGISNFLKNAKLDLALDGAILASVFYNFKNILIQVRKFLTDADPLRKIKDTVGQIYDTLFQLEKKLNADYFVTIGAALLMFAASLLILSSIDGKKLAASLGAITVMFAELVGVMKLMSAMKLKDSKTFKTLQKSLIKIGTTLLLLALALRIAAGALKTFAKVAEMDSAFGGLVLMAATLAALIGTVLLLNKLKAKAIAGAAALLIISAALTALAVAIGAFSLIASMDSAGDGFVLMVMTLGTLLVSLLALSDIAPKVLVGAAAMVVMAGALTVLGIAIGIFTMVASSESAFAGLGLMAASLGVLLISLLALADMELKILAGAAAMVIMAGALLVLSVAMGTFAVIASMNSAWEGLGLMAAAIVVLTAACVGLSAIAAPVLVGAGVLLVMAAALAVFGAGLMVVSAAIPAVALAFSVLGPAIYGLAQSVGLAIAYLMASIGQGLGAILTTIADGIENIIASVGEGIGRGLTGLSEGLSDISKSISEVGTSVGDVGDGIERFGNGIRTLEGIAWVSTAAGMLKIANATKELNKNKFDGDTTDITNYISAINSMVVTIENLSSRMRTAGRNLASSFGGTLVSTIRSYYSSVYSAGQYVVSGFINGINSKTAAAKSAARALGNATNAALKSSLRERSPSKISYQFGEYYSQGLADGMDDTSNKAEKSATNLGRSAIKGLKYAISKVSEIMGDNMDTNPVITPVIDLTNVKSGGRQLNGMLTDMTNKSIGLSSSVSLANSVSSGMRSSMEVQDSSVVDSIKNLINTLKDNDSATMNNTFNINGTNAKEIASEVSKILQTQVERRAASWA